MCLVAVVLIKKLEYDLFLFNFLADFILDSITFTATNVVSALILSFFSDVSNRCNITFTDCDFIKSKTK